jgi:hypothetical protein
MERNKVLPLVILTLFSITTSFSQKDEMVKIVKNEKEQKVDIFIGQKPLQVFYFRILLRSPYYILFMQLMAPLSQEASP